MKLNLTLLIFSIVVSCFSQQKDQKCYIDDINIESNSGIINIGSQQIANQHCNPCYNYYKGDFIVRIDTKPISKETKDKETFHLVNEQEKSKISEEIFNALAELPDNCQNDVIADAKKQGKPYQVFESDDSYLMKISYDENQLQKFGLKIKSEAGNGISRVKEMGRYYYIRYNGSPLPNQVEPERYDFAGDFQDGFAVVGILSPTMKYWLIDTYGMKSLFSFTSYERNPAAYSGVIKIKRPEGYFLANSKLQLLSKPFSQLDAYKESGYFVYRNFRESKLGASESDGLGTRNPYTEPYPDADISSPTLYGAFTLDQSKAVINDSGEKYESVFPWGNDILYVTQSEKNKPRRYRLVDAENGKEIYASGEELNFIEKDEISIRFSASRITFDGEIVYSDGFGSPDWHNNQGYIIGKGKFLTIIPPIYDEIIPGTLGYFRVKSYKKKDKNLYTYTYINTKGEPVFKKYSYLDERPDQKGYIIAATLEDKWGVIDSKEKNIIPFMYDKIKKFPAGSDITIAEKAAFDFGLLHRNGTYVSLNTINEYNYSYRVINADIEPSGLENIFIIHFEVALSQGYGNVYSIVNSKMELLIDRMTKKPVVTKSPFEGVSLVTDNENTYRYIKYGELYNKDLGKVLSPFNKKGLAAAKCSEGGVCIVNASGNIYRNCMPYDDLSEIINDEYVVAKQGNAKGIVNITTGEKYIGLIFDDITYVNNVFVCTKEKRSFAMGQMPVNKIFPFVSGDKTLYEEGLSAINN